MTALPLVLAAGLGSRFGTSSKLRANLKGAPVLSHVFRALVDAGLDEGLVALPAGTRGDKLSELVPKGFQTCRVNQKKIGMGLSLSALAKAVQEPRDVLVVLGDMPLIKPSTFAALANHDQAEIIRPSFQGEQGHPVRFSAKFLPDLTNLSNDEGARSLLAKYGYKSLDFDDPGVIADIDTPRDLDRLTAYV